MAKLEAATNFMLETDFAILSADQPYVLGAASYMQSYAASAPGSVNMMAGTKYASISIRLERWTGRPPEMAGWEDSDELPWRTLPRDRVLVVNGFESANGEPLPLGGLESGRVRVLARGRHRYFYGSFVPSLPPEEWLVQLWPEAAAPDALAGPPRRVGQPWREPLRAWHASGWYALLSAYNGFFQILEVLGRFPGGFTQASIAEDWSETCMEGLPATRWDDSTSPTPAGGGPVAGERKRGWVSDFAASRGCAPLRTIGDLWACMVEVGMITHGGQPGSFAVSRPTVSAVEEPTLPTDVLEEVRGNQMGMLQFEAGYMAGDIRHLVGWSPHHTLVTSPAKVAVRYDVAVDLVIAALRMLSREYSVEPDLQLIAADTLVAVRSKHPPPEAE